MGNLFTHRTRRWAALAAFTFLMPLLSVRANAEHPLDPYLGDPGHTYPNLVPNVVDVQIQPFRIVQDGLGENGLFLWFDTRAQNLGTVPVQLTVDEIESPEVSTVSQCVSWRLAAAHLCRETAPVGGFIWHDAHRHFHYEDFARYELRRLTKEGRADYSDGGLLRVSEKVSFCLIDSEKVRDDARPTPLYESCLPAVQGISPGWTDIYASDYEGQNFSIEGLSDGRYAVVIDMNYRNTLRETDYTDNLFEGIVEISGGMTSAAVVDRYWPTPDARSDKVEKPKKDKA